MLLLKDRGAIHSTRTNVPPFAQTNSHSFPPSGCLQPVAVKAVDSIIISRWGWKNAVCLNKSVDAAGILLSSQHLLKCDPKTTKQSVSDVDQSDLSNPRAQLNSEPMPDCFQESMPISHRYHASVSLALNVPCRRLYATA